MSNPTDLLRLLHAHESRDRMSREEVERRARLHAVRLEQLHAMPPWTLRLQMHDAIQHVLDACRDAVDVSPVLQLLELRNATNPKTESLLAVLRYPQMVRHFRVAQVLRQWDISWHERQLALCRNALLSCDD